MNTLSLKTAAVVSLLIHGLFFLFLGVTLKKNHRLTLPEVYTVKIVAPKQSKRHSAKATTVARIKRIKQKRRAILKKKKAVTLTTEKEKKAPSVKSEPRQKTETREHLTPEEEIALLEAKKRIRERVELRKRVLLSIQAVGSEGDGSQGITEGYNALVREKIWQEWIVPEFIRKLDLEAIVKVRVRRDGTVEILGMQKASGNRVFDRSVVRAIQKASPLPPPPKDMEMLVRFRPCEEC